MKGLVTDDIVGIITVSIMSLLTVIIIVNIHILRLVSGFCIAQFAFIIDIIILIAVGGSILILLVSGLQWLVRCPHISNILTIDTLCLEADKLAGGHIFISGFLYVLDICAINTKRFK